MWGDIPTPHGPCAYCFNPYHHVSNCPEMRQFSNYHHEHMNTQFSRLGNDFYSDSYNSVWSQQSNFSRQGLKEKGVYEVNGNNGVQTQMATMEMKLDMLVKVMTTHNISPIQQIAQVEVCATCSHSDHTTETCPIFSFTDQEQANYVGQNNYPPKNNPYSHTYNAGWRNHLNFSWSNNQNVQNTQGAPPPQAVQPNPEPKKNDLESALLQFMTAQQQSNTQTSQAIQRLETQVGQLAKELSERKRGEFPMEADSEQIINHLKREREEELQSQLVADPNGYYVEDWSSSYHEQAITTLRSEEVENQEQDGNDKQIEVTHDLHQEKGKEVSTEASSALTHIPELPRCHESSLLGPLDEQTEVIKVEKLSKYSPHSISVHDSLSDEKLFENSQSDLPRSVKIRNYLFVGRIHSLWSKRRIDWCFKFKLKSYYQKRSSSPGAQAHLPKLVVLRPLHALKIHIL